MVIFFLINVFLYMPLRHILENFNNKNKKKRKELIVSQTTFDSNRLPNQVQQKYSFKLIQSIRSDWNQVGLAQTGYFWPDWFSNPKHVWYHGLFFFCTHLHLLSYGLCFWYIFRVKCKLGLYALSKIITLV